MAKKIKTPRTGKPPAGYIRVVIDYPEDMEDPLALTWDINYGHRIGHQSNKALAPWGRLVRYIKRTDG